MKRFIRRTLYRLSARLPARLIRVKEQPYLERYHVASLGPYRIFLHRFVRHDSEEHVHDHPWRWALSLVLTGRYREQLATVDDTWVGYRTRERIVRFCNWIGPRTRHRIVGPDPETWTLFITGPSFKGWGFYTIEPVLDSHAVIYHQCFDAPPSKGWYRTAPIGAAVGREPLTGA